MAAFFNQRTFSTSAGYLPEAAGRVNALVKEERRRRNRAARIARRANRRSR